MRTNLCCRRCIYPRVLPDVSDRKRNCLCDIYNVPKTQPAWGCTPCCNYNVTCYMCSCCVITPGNTEFINDNRLNIKINEGTLVYNDCQPVCGRSSGTSDQMDQCAMCNHLTCVYKYMRIYTHREPIRYISPLAWFRTSPGVISTRQCTDLRYQGVRGLTQLHSSFTQLHIHVNINTCLCIYKLNGSLAVTVSYM